MVYNYSLNKGKPQKKFFSYIINNFAFENQKLNAIHKSNKYLVEEII